MAEVHVRADREITAVLVPHDVDIVLDTGAETIVVHDSLVIHSPEGEQGIPGERGPAGVPGPPGHDGDVGPRGPEGTQGPSGLRGPQGRAGDAGPRGSEGSPGPRGPEGLFGPPGRPGAAGSPGKDGPAGQRGKDGQTGPRGLQGLIGTRGATGPRGKDGQPGRQGDRGERGYQGVPGATTGISGPPGRDGVAGPPGPPGPGFTLTLVARENIPAFAVVAIDSAGLAYLPDKDVIADASRIAGVATTSALTGESFVVLTDGTLLIGGTWTMGPLYLGDSGVLTSTPPAALYQLQIGTAVTTGKVIVRPQMPIVLV